MLLDVRIRLQKALLALNSLPQGDKVGEFKTSDTIETLNTAMSKTYTLFAHSLQLRTVIETFNANPNITATSTKFFK